MNSEQEIMDVAKRLKEENRELLIQFAKLLESRQKMSGAPRNRAFWKNLAGGFQSKAIREMEEAIEDCERIDEDGWR